MGVGIRDRSFDQSQESGVAGPRNQRFLRNPEPGTDVPYSYRRNSDLQRCTDGDRNRLKPPAGVSGCCPPKAFVVRCEMASATLEVHRPPRLPRFNAVLAARGQIRFPRRREPTMAVVLWRGTAVRAGRRARQTLRRTRLTSPQGLALQTSAIPGRSRKASSSSARQNAAQC